MMSEQILQTLGSAAWGFRALTLQEQLRLSKKLGMATHELGIANADTDLTLDVSDETIEQVKRLYEENGLKLLCAATGDDLTSEDPVETAAQVAKIKRVLQICSKLGVRLLRVFTGFTTLSQMNEVRWANLEQALAQISDAADACGVTLCIETHGAVEPCFDGIMHIRSTTTQPEDLQRVLKATKGRAKLVFDPANLSAVGEEDLHMFWNKVGSHTGYIHMKDFRIGEKGELYPCALGDGKTAWSILVPELAQSSLPVLFEYELPEDLEQGMVRCLRCWKQLANI